MKVLQLADAIRYRTMSTNDLRSTFLIEDLFQPGKISLTYVDLDRTVIGSAVPLTEPLILPTDDNLKANYFLERRELGILNVGGAGTIKVGKEAYPLSKLEALYVGRGNQLVAFDSEDSKCPAEFYLLSYPAHATYPTIRIKGTESSKARIGSQETANLRDITKLVFLDSTLDGPRSCQLVMGYTELQTGSVWNTMPPHTHMRRSEVYFYFDLPDQQRVFHMMGPADETRHIVVANKQVVVSPGWSIHAGVGTSNYTFCWGMGGENQAYDDMDTVGISSIV